MSIKPSAVAAAVACALVHASPAAAQAVAWRAVAGQSGSVAVANLPPGVDRSYSDVSIGSAGAGMVGMRVSSPSASSGYWARRNGVLSRYVQAGVTGPLGPGRGAGETQHVFLSYQGGWSEAGPDGQRVFAARAGDPALGDAQASWGLWRWDGTKNVEIARVLTDGALGPGLGAGWRFQNSPEFAGARMVGGGRALLVGTVTTPSTATRDVVVLHDPGTGNVPCALEDSTDPTLAPGLVAGDSFPADWNGSLSVFAVSAEGAIYARLQTSNSRGGIWQLCDGAPRALVADDDTGALGPELGVETAYFSSVYGPPKPADAGRVFFVATGRVAVGGASFGGLFHHDANGNWPLALNGDTGAYSPHWLDATFTSVDESTLTAAGEWAAFEATLHTGDGASPVGLFRVRPGEAPEPVAIIGADVPYAPEPNRIWSSLRASAVLANGDIVLEAYTNPDNEYALWLLKRGEAPRRVLRAGDVAWVPTAAGNVQAAITSFTPAGGAGVAQYDRGGDSWIGADGTILVSASVNGYGSVLLMATPSNPIDLIFRNGYDG
ncbi:MAG: hypothetical protein ACTHK2_18610 [Dokdonella sp.]|uniref:hypothetical protein n=1 Tax=Dokdonella sp. TaxID=2291710 RepID=UPI003F7DECD0